MKTIFTEHPNSLGESYFEHLGFALKCSWTLFIAALACFMHAVFPFICQTSGSHYVSKLALHLSSGNRKEVFDEHLRRHIENLKDGGVSS